MNQWYKNGIEHLIELLDLYDMMLQQKIVEFRSQFVMQNDPGQQFFAKQFISDEQIDSLMNQNGRNSGESVDKDECRRLTKAIADKRLVIQEKVAVSYEKGVVLPLIELIHNFNLTPDETDIFCLCLLPEIDTKYGKIFAYLQDTMSKKAPGVDLILSILCNTFDDTIKKRCYFTSRASLFYYNLLIFINNEHNQDTPLLQKQLKVSDRIIDFLLDNESVYCDDTLIPFVTIDRCMENLKGENIEQFSYFLQNIIIENINNSINSYQDGVKDHVFLFYGEDEMMKYKTVLLFCTSINVSLLTLDMEKVMQSGDALMSILYSVIREYRLYSYILYIKNAHLMINNRSILNILIPELNKADRPVFIGSDYYMNSSTLMPGKKVIEQEFKVPDFAHRLSLWRYLLEEKGICSDTLDLTGIANKFTLSTGQIHNAVVTASNKSVFNTDETGTVTNEALYHACHNQSNQNLSALAQKIDCKYRWDDIVLPDEQLGRLGEILDYIKYQYVVFDTWGFDKKLSYGKGLTVLFSGASGTGKTMSAEIIATESNLDLYKIDLSNVVSKYIGETEKNLNHIFTEAQTSNAILFFDEADALFGKRSDVKDAHDRYSNIETGYLLQKMEEYEGAVILATNLRNNLDDAFIRRLKYTIDYPFPEKEDRLCIWKKIFPAETPVDTQVDYDFLAGNFSFTGGNIKNIALTASFYAAAGSRQVTMKDIILACKREYQKMGRLCIKSDFGQYYDLLGT